MKRYLILIAFFAVGQIYSQDINGANISTKWISNFTYSITVRVFTSPSQNIARPTIQVNFGDGQAATFSLTNITSGGGVVKIYSGTHSYVGSGFFNIFYLDSFRVAGIKNMANSQVQHLYVEATINLANLGANTSPLINNYPFTLSGPANPLYYNPGYYDIDGDSLSYLLTPCSGAGYYLPSGSAINAVTGLLSFVMDTAGLYAFKITVKEWRKNTSGIYSVIASSQLDFNIDVTSTIGIKEVIEIPEPAVYPNPVAGELSILSNSNAYLDHGIEIINARGQVVLRSRNSSKINVSDLPEGTYTLLFYFNNNSPRTLKLLKN